MRFRIPRLSETRSYIVPNNIGVQLGNVKIDKSRYVRMSHFITVACGTAAGKMTVKNNNMIIKFKF